MLQYRRLKRSFLFCRKKKQIRNLIYSNCIRGLKICIQVQNILTTVKIFPPRDLGMTLFGKYKGWSNSLSISRLLLLLFKLSIR